MSKRSRNIRPRSGVIRTSSWRTTIAASRCAARPEWRKRGRISSAPLRSGRILQKPSSRCAWRSFRRFIGTQPRSASGAAPMPAGWRNCPRMWRTRPSPPLSLRRSARTSRSIFPTRAAMTASFRPPMARWSARSWPRDLRRRFCRIRPLRARRSGSVSSAGFSGSTRTGKSRSRDGSKCWTAIGFNSRAITRVLSAMARPRRQQRCATASCRARYRSTHGGAE